MSLRGEDEAHISVEVAYLLTQQVRGASGATPPTADAWPLASSRAYQPPIPGNRSPRGGALRKWKDAFLTTLRYRRSQQRANRASADGIELGGLPAGSYRNPATTNSECSLIAGGLDTSTHTQV